MPASEFVEWLTYYSVTRFADETTREGLDLLAVLVNNAHYEDKRKIGGFIPDPFIEDKATQQPKGTDWEQLEATMKRLSGVK